MLRLEDIRLQLGRFRLRIDRFHILPGEYRVLLGPTGTGKTVLLETIAGLHTPQRGRIILDGRDVTRSVPEHRDLCVVYQEYALFPHLDVFANIAFGLRLQHRKKNSIRKDVEEMAEFFGISHLLSRRPGNLSGGERQRVALARALVLRPLLLLLDEPLSAVDLLTRDRLRRELKRIREELGTTVLHITHDLNEAFFLADRMTVMRDGALLQEGTPDTIARRPADRFVAELMGMKNLLPARVGADGTIAVQDFGTLDPGLLADPPAGPREILVTCPSWAIELEPGPDTGPHWWQGSAMITHVLTTESQVELELRVGTTTRLHTILSHREAGRLPAAPEPGRQVRLGIGHTDLHWLPVTTP